MIGTVFESTNNNKDKWKAASALKVLEYLVLVLPAIFCFVYIHVYGVYVPFWDEWSALPIIIDAWEHNLSFSELWAQHNQNRMLIPNLIFLLMAKVTHLNVKLEMYLSAILITASCLIVILLYRKRISRPIYFLPVFMLLYNPIQLENLLWGFQVAWYVILFCTIVSLALLCCAPRSWWSYFISCLSAVIASFSSIQGLIVWPVAVIVLLLKEGKRVIWQARFWGWIALSVVVTALYFSDFNFEDTGGSPLTYAVHHPLSLLEYFLMALGNVVPLPEVSLFSGIVMFLLFGIVTKRVLMTQDRSELAFPYSLVIFAVLFDVMIAIGRSGFGPVYSLSSRYTTYNLVMLAAFVMIAFRKSIHDRFSYWLKGAVTVFLVIQLPLSYQIGLEEGKNYKISRLAALQTLINYSTASDNQIQSTLFPDAGKVRMLAEYLAEHKLGPFHYTDKVSNR